MESLNPKHASSKNSPKAPFCFLISCWSQWYSVFKFPYAISYAYLHIHIIIKLYEIGLFSYFSEEEIGFGGEGCLI